MRPVLLLAAGLGIATAASPPAQAQNGFTPCGDRVTAQNWARHISQGSNVFRWQATLRAPVAVRVQIQLRRGPGFPRSVGLTAEAFNGLDLQAGVPRTLTVVSGVDPLMTTAVASAITFLCAAPA